MCSYVNSKYPKKKQFSQTILQFICRQYKQELNSVIVVCSRKKLGMANMALEFRIYLNGILI